MQGSPHTRMPSTRLADFAILKKLWRYLVRFRFRVMLALGSLILAKLCNVMIPLVFKDIVDYLEPVERMVVAIPIALVIAYGLARAGASLFNELRDALFAKVRHRIMRVISNDVLTHLHTLSLRFHLNRKTGAITRDMERGAKSINSLMNLLLFNVIPTLVEMNLIIGIFLINYSVWYAIVTLITVALYIIFTMSVTEWRMKFRVEMNIKDSEASALLLDGLINYETVKYFGNEDYEIRRYDKKMQAWEQSGIKSQTSMSALNFGQAMIIAVGVTVMMLMAVRDVINQTMTLGDLVLINTFMLQLFIPLGFLGIVYSQVKHALSDIAIMFELFDEKPDIVDCPGATALDSQSSSISFENIRFSYLPEREILKGISFTVPAGKKVALVGASGSGKTTIGRLLYRLYQPDSGTIAINGQNIAEVTQQSLRQSIGIVPQDAVLFNDSIEYNIRYASPNASIEAIHHAAKQANIHEFIMSLPEQYATVVGERGLKLSGGEKQRIAIARAILKDPAILIFDEATSSLDSLTEREILRELKQISAHHTTLVIAHRLSTIVDADEIVVLQQGMIAEQGTHQELIARAGLYANLWHQQQQQHDTP
jgi:ATP-binding cassette, subfamily B, heavy metal transporter